MTVQNEISSWLSYTDIQSIPDPIKHKINAILVDYHNTVIALQSDISFNTAFYEKTIEDLKRKLKEENQKLLETEMRVLHERAQREKGCGRLSVVNQSAENMTADSTQQIRVLSRARIYCHSARIVRSVLRLKLQLNTAREAEMREKSLRAQVDFLTEHYGEDEKGLCTLVGSYLATISDLRKKLEEGRYEGVSEMRDELERMRRGEKELQNHIYEKAKEMHGLQSELNEHITRNGILEQYRTRYKMLHDEYIKIGVELSESRRRNVESRIVVEEAVNLLREDINRFMSQVEERGKYYREPEADRILEVKGRLLDMRETVDLMDRMRIELVGIVDMLLWRNSEQQRMLEAGIGKEGRTDALAVQVELLRMENEGLLRRIENSRAVPDILLEDERVRRIGGEKEEIKREMKRLEEEAEGWKQGMKEVEMRFSEYREKFEEEETRRQKEILQENVMKKNVLIGKMRELIEKYRELLDRRME